MLDPFDEGQDMKVHFDLRGREWNGKYFTNLNAWKLESNQMGNTGGFPEEEDFVFTDERENDSLSQEMPGDDLPF